MTIRNYVTATLVGFFGLTQTLAFAGTAKDSGIAYIGQSFSGGDLMHIGLSVLPWTVDGNSAREVFKKDMKVPAGNHIVGLQIEFQVKWRKYKDLINFQGRFLSGHRYVAQGRQSGEVIDVWIADAQSQQLASKVLSIYAKECNGFDCPEPELKIRQKL